MAGGASVRAAEVLGSGMVLRRRARPRLLAGRVRIEGEGLRSFCVLVTASVTEAKGTLGAWSRQELAEAVSRSAGGGRPPLVSAVLAVLQ